MPSKNWSFIGFYLINEWISLFVLKVNSIIKVSGTENASNSLLFAETINYLM